MSRLSPFPQNGPSPANAALSAAAASKRLFALSGPSSTSAAIRDHTASHPSRPVSIRAVPAGYPKGKSKPRRRRRPASVARASNPSIRSTASARVAGFSGASIPPRSAPASQMLSFPLLGTPLADQSTATYPSKSATPCPVRRDSRWSVQYPSPVAPVPDGHWEHRPNRAATERWSIAARQSGSAPG